MTPGGHPPLTLLSAGETVDVSRIMRSLASNPSPARKRCDGRAPRPTTGSGPRAWLAVCLVVSAALLVVPTAAHAQAIGVTVSDGLGRVTSDPPGIDCPGTCTAPFAADNDVTLIATPAPGYAFGVPDQQGDPVDESGWRFGCEEVPSDPLRCTVDVLPSGETGVDAAFRPAALLLVVANGGGGSVTATVSNPQVGETGQQTCNSDQRGGVVCPFPYLPGRAVALTPSPFAAPFPVWSDDDCLDAAPCTLVLDELRRSITATFATQNVFVRVNGPGRVFSTPAGLDCTFAEDEVPADCPDEATASFPTGEEVTLTAVGTTPVWETDPSPTRAGCDSTDGAVCRVVAERTRWAAVEFAGAQNDGQYPPRASARFRARKAGDGSGKVSGSGINCGSRCSVETSYGERFVLVADASPGSRFVRWRRGCGKSARCALTVGPITRVTAVFERCGARGDRAASHDQDRAASNDHDAPGGAEPRPRAARSWRIPARAGDPHQPGREGGCPRDDATRPDRGPAQLASPCGPSAACDARAGPPRPLPAHRGGPERRRPGPAHQPEAATALTTEAPVPSTACCPDRHWYKRCSWR